MTRSTLISFALLSPLMFTGCASIVNGQNQSLSVTSDSNGAATAGAKCSLVNNKGTWFATTPGSVTVRRSYEPLNVNCTLDGFETGSVTIKSATKAMAFGNIIFGGVIGAGVDISTGAAYDYPELIKISMTPLAAVPPADAASAAAAAASPVVAVTAALPASAPAK